MANMSYCQFENTLSDMYQVLQTMREAGSVEDLDLNSYELVAFKQFGDVLGEMTELWTRLAETLEVN